MNHVRRWSLSSLPLAKRHTKQTINRRFLTGTKPRRQKASEPVPSTKAKMKDPDQDSDLWLGTHMERLVYSFGFVYVFTEYGMELTICEGPSMLPTIKPQGEIVVLDRLTPRLFGLEGGSSGRIRTKEAREKQKEHEALIKAGKRQQIEGRNTWYQLMIPVNKLPSDGTWHRFMNQVKSGISVGDVVVLQHPDRVGTVCKRVLGLPGDMVTKPTRRTKKQHILDRRRPGLYVVPDGHIWVEGDNPWNSSDSRNYGAVPASLIMGRVLFRLWPLRGHAIMERGGRPESQDDDEPELTFSGSIVFPAGYDNQVIVTDPTDEF